MTTLQDRLIEASRALQAAGIDSAARDARLLLAHVHQIDVSRLTLHLPENDDWDAGQELHWQECIAARCAHKPVAKITGRKGFWGRDFYVTEDVLDPRPETETLIAAALDLPFDHVLDLGTGSGAIIISLLAERITAQGVGTDLSAPALRVAQHNADAAALGDRLTLQQADIFADWPQGRFDLIVSNPPYLAAKEMDEVPQDTLYDPRMSLTDEDDGLSFYRRIAARAPQSLTQQRCVIVEIGPSQGAAVSNMFTLAGFKPVTILPDLDGRDRAVQAIWPE